MIYIFFCTELANAGVTWSAENFSTLPWSFSVNKERKTIFFYQIILRTMSNRKCFINDNVQVWCRCYYVTSTSNLYTPKFYLLVSFFLFHYFFSSLFPSISYCVLCLSFYFSLSLFSFSFENDFSFLSIDFLFVTKTKRIIIFMFSYFVKKNHLEREKQWPRNFALYGYIIIILFQSFTFPTLQKNEGTRTLVHK